MRIEKLHLKNFRCFEDLEINFPESNLAVFIGLNGAGKTAILDALSICNSNFPDIVIPRLSNSDDTKKTTKVEVYKNITGDFKNNLGDISIGSLKNSNKVSLSHLEKSISWATEYSKDSPNTCRLNIGKEDGFSNNEQLEIFKSFIYIYYNTKKEIYSINWTGSHYYTFDSFENWFEEEENIENELISDKKDFSFTNPKLNVTRKAMSLFLSNLSNANFHDLKVKRIYNKTEKMGTYEEEIKKHESFLIIKHDDQQLKLSQLSAGQKILLHLVGDISYRLVIASNVPEENDDYCNIILASGGIVLIDEIDLHLHPEWQREVLPALQKTFPNIQFIITTHSPQVLSNVKKEEIFILEDNIIVKNTPNVEGRDSNSILYDLYGVEERPEKYKEKLNEFYGALDDEKIERAKDILSSLTEIFGEEDIEIVKANLHLDFSTEE